MGGIVVILDKISLSLNKTSCPCKTRKTQNLWFSLSFFFKFTWVMSYELWLSDFHPWYQTKLEEMRERERERERERGVGSLGFYVWITISQFLKLGFIIFLWLNV